MTLSKKQTVISIVIVTVIVGLLAALLASLTRIKTAFADETYYSQAEMDIAVDEAYRRGVGDLEVYENKIKDLEQQLVDSENQYNEMVAYYESELKKVRGEVERQMAALESLYQFIIEINPDEMGNVETRAAYVLQLSTYEQIVATQNENIEYWEHYKTTLPDVAEKRNQAAGKQQEIGVYNDKTAQEHKNQTAFAALKSVIEYMSGLSIFELEINGEFQGYKFLTSYNLSPFYFYGKYYTMSMKKELNDLLYGFWSIDFYYKLPESSRELTSEAAPYLPIYHHLMDGAALNESNLNISNNNSAVSRLNSEIRNLETQISETESLRAVAEYQLQKTRESIEVFNIKIIEVKAKIEALDALENSQS